MVYQVIGGHPARNSFPAWTDARKTSRVSAGLFIFEAASRRASPFHQRAYCAKLKDNFAAARLSRSVICASSVVPPHSPSGHLSCRGIPLYPRTADSHPLPHTQRLPGALHYNLDSTSIQTDHFKQQTLVQSWLNHYSAEIFLYKPWRPKGVFFNFKSS